MIQKHQVIAAILLLTAVGCVTYQDLEREIALATAKQYRSNRLERQQEYKKLATKENVDYALNKKVKSIEDTYKVKLNEIENFARNYVASKLNRIIDLIREQLSLYLDKEEVTVIVENIVDNTKETKINKKALSVNAEEMSVELCEHTALFWKKYKNKSVVITGTVKEFMIFSANTDFVRVTIAEAESGSGCYNDDIEVILSINIASKINKQNIIKVYCSGGFSYNIGTAIFKGNEENNNECQLIEVKQ